MSRILEDKVVVVTGAATGLGAGIAEALLETGAKVVLSDIKADALRETASRLDPAGEKSCYVVADVTKARDIEGLFSVASKELGRVDGLVNNAGVIVMSDALDESAENLNLQFDVNVAGLFECCKAAVRLMKEQQGGALVNIASNAGKVGFPSMAGYNASKAAVISLTRTLAAEWARYRVNVNAVCPGSVDTPMLFGVAEFLSKQTGAAAADIFQTMRPKQLGRHIKAVEVGRIVAFLLSPAAEIIRGQSINVDGGETPY
jgi:meso-butanediol dehydrogenase/(S,S)-butanediol dehydrogenase/diacetyl reductase